jgi:hypothetical protein
MTIVTGWAVGIFIAALTGTGSFEQPHVIVAMLWVIGPGSWFVHRHISRGQRQAAAKRAAKTTPPAPAA